MTMQDDHYISVFTPSRTAPETLEHIFVQREPMLVEAIARVDECLSRDTRHQQLIVGPRGAGKTHFITLLVHRLARQARTQRPTLRIAWMNEDETFTSFLDVLIGLYRALNKRQPDEFPLQRLDTLYASPDTAETALAQAIVDILQQHQCCCLLVVENLDQLFESIGLQGQQKLRAYLQESRCFTLFATAQKLTRALKDRGEPFFGFFQTDHLQPLNEAEATRLIGRITQLNDDDQQGSEVSAFLQTPHGQARIAALHHLSGGNHRMYIVLSQFISRDSIDALVRPFLKMVDELTPYYQERIRWLPPLQRKIIEVLCADRHTVSVNDIARRVFRSNQSIAAQLKELKDKGYVRANKRGRESLYEVTEPLMRICVEVKNNQQSKPIALLVEFIRAWYDREAIETRLQHEGASALSKRYLHAAMQAHTDADKNLSGFISQEEVDRIGPAAVIHQLTAVVELKGALVEQIASALINRGVMHGKLGDYVAAIADCTRVIELEGASVGQIASALANRGVMHGQLGDYAAAIADCARVMELEDVSVESVANALMNRGIMHAESGDFSTAMRQLTTVVELEGAPVRQVANALINRGHSYNQLGDSAAAIADCTRVIELEDAPVELVAMALVNRGIMHGQLGDFFAATADCTRVIELEDVPVEQFARALFNRSITHTKLDDLATAVADCTSIIELEGSPVEVVVAAWMLLAILHLCNHAWSQAVEAMRAGLSVDTTTATDVNYNTRGIVTVLFTHTAVTAMHNRVVEVADLFSAGLSGTAELAAGLIQHLGTLAQRDPLPSADQLTCWLDAWSAAAKQHPGLVDGVRILKVGIAYLQGNRDQTQLLDLVETDRKILASVLNLSG